MFCQYCGNQIPDDAKFCANCGGQIAAGGASRQQPTAKTTAPQSAAAKGTKKKKPNLLIVLIVVVVCYFIGRMMGGSMADSMSDNSGSGSQSGHSAYADSAQNAGSSLADSDGVEYENIFLNRGIVTAPAFFGTLDSVAYANVDSDGYIDNLQFAYENNTIVQMVETVYIPIDGLSDADKQALDSNCRAAYAEAETLSFVSITSNIGYSYYSMTITIKDLNQVENVQSAVNAGLLTLTDSSASVMSMSATEDSLLAQGYVKK